MKRCLSCSTFFDSHAAWSCPTCNWTPEISNNVTLFCDHNSNADGGYDPAWYIELAPFEKKTFGLMLAIILSIGLPNGIAKPINTNM